MLALIGAVTVLVLLAVIMPLSLLFDPDSHYFGVMPVVAQVTGTLGGHPIQVAQASLLGQMTFAAVLFGVFSL